MEARETPAISVILPALNEADNIGRTIARALYALSGTADTYELIVVDDGSNDDTYERARALSLGDNHIRVLRNDDNVGKGFAVKRAAKYTSGGSVIVLDADMEIDPGQLQAYLHLLKEYDFCIASKRHPKSVYRAPLARKLLSISFNKLVRLLTGVKCADSQTGLKAMRGGSFRTIMDVVLVKRYAYDVEVLALAQEMGLRVAELPVNIEQGARFRAKAVMLMLIDLLGIAYRLRIRKCYQKKLREHDAMYHPIIPL
jgi:glycosyltransferase involved in cell wall biosynthesis